MDSKIQSLESSLEGSQAKVQHLDTANRELEKELGIQKL